MEQPENKISPEMAENDFNRWAEEMDIEQDVSLMDEDDLKGYETAKSKILKAIMKGTGTINDDGEFVYIPKKSLGDAAKPITFHERTGASLIAMDSVKKGKDVTKMYRVLADMCKVPPVTFSNMKGIDIKTCEAAFVLLMG